MDIVIFFNGFNHDMEPLFILKNVYLHLGIILLSLVIKVSGEALKKQLIPNFIPERSNHVVVHRGDTAILRCTIRDLGPKSVAWRKMSEFFPLSVGKMMYAPNDEMSIDYHQENSVTNVNLIIKQANPSHSGEYECQISAALVYTYHVRLTVLQQPRVIKPTITITGLQYINVYQRLNLTCNSTGPLRAPKIIDWFHEGNVIDGRKSQWHNRVVVTNFVPEFPGRSLISQISIDRLQFADAGIYVCRSSTPGISDVETTSINVHVLGAGDNIVKIKREDDKNTQSDNSQQKYHNCHPGMDVSEGLLLSMCLSTLLFQTLR